MTFEPTILGKPAIKDIHWTVSVKRVQAEQDPDTVKPADKPAIVGILRKLNIIRLAPLG